MTFKNKKMEFNWINVNECLPADTKEVFGHTGTKLGLCIVRYTRGGQIQVDDDGFESENDYADWSESSKRVTLTPGWYELIDDINGPNDEIYVKRDIKFWAPIPECFLNVS